MDCDHAKRRYSTELTSQRSSAASIASLHCARVRSDEKPLSTRRSGCNSHAISRRNARNVALDPLARTSFSLNSVAESGARSQLTGCAAPFWNCAYALSAHAFERRQTVSACNSNAIPRHLRYGALSARAILWLSSAFKTRENSDTLRPAGRRGETYLENAKALLSGSAQTVSLRLQRRLRDEQIAEEALRIDGIIAEARAQFLAQLADMAFDDILFHVVVE